MFLTERIIDQQHRNEIERQKAAIRREDPEEDDMGMAYAPRAMAEPLNMNEGVFASKDKTSINTAPSVFDRTALFHVNREES